MKTILLLLILFAATASANEAQQFHQALYALHERQLAQHAVRTEEESGNYEGEAAARYGYVDTRYYDAPSGRLLARVRRDAEDADLVHIIEVNVYENGRLVRDFGSITLPWAPRHPVRTMINLHQYPGALHSFRQYNIFGEVTFESCEGLFEGKRVSLALDGSNILPAVTSSASYRACFEGLAKDWQSYKTPH